jgi:hypothetical protein
LSPKRLTFASLIFSLTLHFVAFVLLSWYLGFPSPRKRSELSKTDGLIKEVSLSIHQKKPIKKIEKPVCIKEKGPDSLPERTLAMPEKNPPVLPYVTQQAENPLFDKPQFSDLALSFSEVEMPKQQTLLPSYQPYHSHLIASVEKNRDLSSLTPILTPIDIPVQTIDIATQDNELPKLEEKGPALFINPLPKKNKDSLPTLASMATISWDNHFDYDLVYYPEKDGYVFALTLMPKEEISFPRMKQHVFFLIDSSHSITSIRLKNSVHAVMRALHNLHSDDRISIISFGSKLQRVVSNVPNSERNRKTIRNLCKSIQKGTIFATSDPYKPLKALLANKYQPNMIESVVLLSDGSGLLGKKGHPFLLYNWLIRNKGRYHVHAVGTLSDKKKALGLMTLFNKGELLLSGNISGLKRKTEKLLHHVSYPIAKDLEATAICQNGTHSLQLLPSTICLPALYKDSPMVFWGKTKDLKDFTFFLQGRNEKNWISIKKKISFAKATPAPPSFQKKWALQKSYDCYEQYFKKQDPSYLLDAVELLEPYDEEPLIR